MTDITTTFNIERLREAVAWVEFEAKREKSKWRQSNWAQGKMGRKRNPKRYEGGLWTEPDQDLVQVKCPSAYCVAGWVCAGEKDTFVGYNWATDSEGALTADYVIPKGSREMKRVSTRAQELLGISEQDANLLFSGYNSIGDIKRHARRIAKKDGETL